MPHPTLTAAANDIKKILLQYDIAGVVCLHTPGHGETVVYVSPSYSCARLTTIDGEAGIGVRSRLQEDYGGDRDAKQAKDSATSNMLSLLAEMTGKIALSFIEINDVLDQKSVPDNTNT